MNRNDANMDDMKDENKDQGSEKKNGGDKSGR